MAVQGAVRLDKVNANKTGRGLISFKATADTQNGSVFFAEDLVSGERELFTPVQPLTATLAGKSLYLAASPEVVYLAGQTILDYYTPSGSAGRGINLSVGDLVTISDLMISGTTVVGQWVMPANASSLLAISASLPTTTKFIGKIVEKGTIYGQAATVIEVLVN